VTAIQQPTRGSLSDCGLLVCAIALSRFAFRSRYLYDIDSVNYALALDHFDPAVHQPHPPGYFLYVQLGRLARLIFHDPNTALVALSIVASCAAACLTYKLAQSWFGRRAAVFAGLIFVFSPLCWFHGIVALTYIVEAFFSVLVGYFCWRIYGGDSRFLLPAAIALGVAAGCRQSSILFLSPLWLLSMSRTPRKQIWTGALALIATVAAWFVPMLQQSGGAERYFASFLALWHVAAGKDTVFNAPIAMSVARLITICGVIGLCFGSATLLFFRPRARAGVRLFYKDQKLFTWVWIGPGLLFFTFIFFKYVNSGYLLILSPPIFCWLGAWMAEWYGPAGAQAGKALLVGALAAVNLLGFVWAPVYCSYWSVRNAESELIGIRDDLQRIATSGDTLIVGFDSHFLGYRHAGYYLPQYLTVQFPELSYPDGKRVFSLENRETRLLRNLAIDRFKHFIFFPLPSGSAYARYSNEVRRRFPKGALTSVFAGGREYVSGSAADLPVLFPNVARKRGQLYAESYSSK
jgi:4-amino-4-deoxy-L-arabinose transferase-like glycosyltransferase